jgi:hypothetical protein
MFLSLTTTSDDGSENDDEVQGINSTEGAVAARNTLPMHSSSKGNPPPHTAISRRDPVHEVFQEIIGKPLKRKCTLCTKEVAKSGGGLSNLYDHLLRRHADAHKVYKEKQRIWKESKEQANAAIGHSASNKQVCFDKN